MNRKGFTLIELLAVIVILAILAVLVTPMVNDTINNAKQKTFKNTVEGMIRSIQLDASDKDYSAAKYTVADGVILDESGNKVHTSGGSNENGTIHIDEDGNITLSVHDNKWCATKTASNNKIEMSKFEEGACGVIETTNGAQTIIDLGITESGEGLYENPKQNGGGYVFKGGQNKNNLIFDDKCWYVIGIDGNNQVKLILNRKAQDGKCSGSGYDLYVPWNGTQSSYTNYWFDSKTTIRTTLESLARGESFNGFSITNLDKVADHTWNVGAVQALRQSAPQTISEIMVQEKTGKGLEWPTHESYTWKNKVGLINVSDVLKASTQDLCKNESWGGTGAGGYLPYICFSSTAITPVGWTLNAFQSTVYVLHYTSGSYLFPYNNYVFKPVIYLNSNVKITGSGTVNDPFVAT